MSLSKDFYMLRFRPPPDEVHESAFVLPCGFCGGDPMLKRYNYGVGSMGAEPDRVWIECSDCGVESQITWDDGEHDLNDVVAKWNQGRS